MMSDKPSADLPANVTISNGETLVVNGAFAIPCDVSAMAACDKAAPCDANGEKTVPMLILRRNELPREEEGNFAAPRAFLCYDGQTFTMPPDQGEPREDQMQGSDSDRVVEFAGRLCYESLKMPRSRDSAGYHAHIAEVNHSSVLAHACFPFVIRPRWIGDDTMAKRLQLAACFLNRPGCWLTDDPANLSLRVMINARAIRQWQRWPSLFGWNAALCEAVGFRLQEAFFGLSHFAGHGMPRTISMDGLRMAGAMDVIRDEPANEGEIWASFYLTFSRGASHEQVRHAFEMTGISQRSTRFCNEDGTDWVPHPLLDEEERGQMARVQAVANDAYNKVMASVQKRLNDGTEAGNGQALKQARGAARGLLGNALETRLIFSATLMQWKWQLFQRMADTADGEIRLAYNLVFEQLKARWPESFQGYQTRPAKDGVGLVLSAWSDDPGRYGWLVA